MTWCGWLTTRPRGQPSWEWGLGIYFDADISMRCQCDVQRTVANCFAVLRQLRTIRRASCLTSVTSHYLQSVLNAAARSIADSSTYDVVTYDHITDTLVSFHWLKSPELIQHKLIAGDRLSFTELYGPRAPSLPGCRSLALIYFI